VKLTKRPCRRTGAAVVELAVCLPLVFLLAFASNEVADMLFLKQTLYTSAYEGARVAIHPGSSATDVTKRCQEILSARGVNGAAVAVEPANIESQPRGTAIAVTVTAPSGSNSKLPTWFFTGKSLRARPVMMKE
jgi:Flp pilus assembly protein TadG